MVDHSEIAVVSQTRCGWIDITAAIGKAVKNSGIASGICCVSSLHTTAGITINENADPDVEVDFFRSLAALALPAEACLHSEGNSDSHLKASLVGLSASVPVCGGALVLGPWQSIYFCESHSERIQIFHLP